MSRELIAGLLLALLILGAVLNIKAADRMAEGIARCLDMSEQAALAGDAEGAAAGMDAALELWLESEGYTHIFIRHSEIDGTSDAFYDAVEELSDGDSEALSAAYDKLRYHLRSLIDMEHVSLGSIF